MIIEVQVSIDGLPAFWHTARGVYSQGEAEQQAVRIYGDKCRTLGIRTSSEDVPKRRGWFF